MPSDVRFSGTKFRHQIRFPLRLRSRLRWGSLQHSPRPPSCIEGGLLLRGRKGKKNARGTEGEGEEGDGKGAVAAAEGRSRVGFSLCEAAERRRREERGAETSAEGGRVCRKWGGLGRLGGIQGPGQCHHSIERILLSIRL